MGFLEKYYKGIERGESTTEWRAIELADEEIEELRGELNKLRKRVGYDEADEVRLEERLDKLERELSELREKLEDMDKRMVIIEDTIRVNMEVIE